MKTRETAAGTIEAYAALPYTVELSRNADGTMFAAIPDLPGCVTEGHDAADALRMIEDAKRAWLTVALEDGQRIPLPRDLDDFSGKFVVRVPASMHRDLASAARREGVSLNTYVVSALARDLGLR